VQKTEPVFLSVCIFTSRAVYFDGFVLGEWRGLQCDYLCCDYNILSYGCFKISEYFQFWLLDWN